MRLIKRVFIYALIVFVPLGSAIAQQMRTFVDDAGRTVEVPVNPQRVISQNDNRLTLPLLELGVPLVGSSGRIGTDGQPTLRAVPDLLGIDFDSADFAFIGAYNDLDYELITSLNPDLILTMREDQVEQLSKIAPTLVIDPNLLPVKQGIERIAEATGHMDAYDDLLHSYERKLENVRPMFPTGEDIRVNVIFSFASGDRVTVYQDIGAITVALADLGLAPSAFVDGLSQRATQISPENWQDVDADYIINFYDGATGATPDAVKAGLESFVPGWCAYLHACRENQFLFFPYASYGYAFTALELNLDLLTTNIAGRHTTLRSTSNE